MKSLRVILILSGLLTGCQWTIDPAKELQEDTVPVVETGVVTALGTVGDQKIPYADVQVRVVSLGFNTLTEFGIVFAAATNTNPTLQNATKVAASGDGRELTTVGLAHLSFKIPYSYRAYAVNDRGMIGYGEVNTFTSVEKFPDVETIGVTGQPGTTTAQLQCRVTNASEVTLSEYGILYTNTVTIPTRQNSLKVLAPGTTGTTATLSLTGLAPNTIYSYAAFATSTSGISIQGTTKQLLTASFGTPISISGRFRQDNFSNTIQLRFSGDDIEVYGGFGGMVNPDGVYKRTATNAYTYSQNDKLSITAVNTNTITWKDASGSYTFRKIL